MLRTTQGIAVVRPCIPAEPASPWDGLVLVSPGRWPGDTSSLLPAPPLQGHCAAGLSGSRFCRDSLALEGTWAVVCISVTLLLFIAVRSMFSFPQKIVIPSPTPSVEHR